MDKSFREMVWRQFGAAIDALEEAINVCPEKLWADRKRQPEFWYLAFHTLFWLDYYTSEEYEGFTPPLPFGLEERDPAGVLPERPYTKEELLTYLEHGRTKGKKRILSLTDQEATRTVALRKATLSFSELLLYIMRHIQHHSAQLNLILRQETGSAPGWTFISR
ncbi:MAG: DinB family protein [bacterium]|nr:DinB family protein [bacterium]